MVGCLFCKIVKKEIPVEVIYDNDFVLAILDINPCASGHTMVLPKVHVETILDLPEVGSVFEAVKKVTGRLKKVFNPDGFTIGINQGRAAGQAIDHLHIHIIPRYKNDGGVSLHGVVDNPPKESLSSIKDKIIKI